MKNLKSFNLVRINDLFGFYQSYVAEVIADWSVDNDVRPKSFDEWYNVEYLQNIEEYSMETRFELSSSPMRVGVMCRIPQGIVTESGGICDSSLLCEMGARLKAMILPTPKVYWRDIFLDKTK